MAEHHKRTRALFEREHLDPIDGMVREDGIAFPPCFRDFVRTVRDATG
jgi:hypothetical protein